jgi:DNA helicase-2/ATP-dependent DNA helicase PcrA
MSNHHSHFSSSPLDRLALLNPSQREAVEHHLGPILVLAGAGSGKTRILTHRIAHLIEHHQEAPYSIMAVTFTNKAAQEMSERVKGLLGERAKQIWVSTFHSSAVRILRRHASLLGFTNDFVIYDSQDSKNVVAEVIKDFGLDPKQNPPKGFLGMIDLWKMITALLNRP